MPLATLALGSNRVVILDVRGAGVPVQELRGHHPGVNALDWAPHSTHLCTAGEDSQALIWQVEGGGGAPMLTYMADDAINQIKWATTATKAVNWVAICFRNKLQVLRV